jgi:hypothetical protein
VEYEVDKFVNWAAEVGVWKYRARWKGYAPHEDTWEPDKDLQCCEDLLYEFFVNYPTVPKADNHTPTNAPKIKRGGCNSILTSPKPPVLPPCTLLLLSYTPNYLASYPTTCNMPVYQSNTKLPFNHCMDIDFYVQNGSEAMKDNLSSAAKIIHILLNSSNTCNVWHIRLNTYKHPRWEFMCWLDCKGEEGPQSLYGFCIHCWWHFRASTPIAFQDFAKWHCQGFLTPSPCCVCPVISSRTACSCHRMFPSAVCYLLLLLNLPVCSYLFSFTMCSLSFFSAWSELTPFQSLLSPLALYHPVCYH